METCQACLAAPVEREVKSEVESSPFRLCGACAGRLESLALRPLEWYRLAALHGPFTVLLGEHLYDEDGRAGPHRVSDGEATSLPMPTLDAVATDAGALLDHVLTQRRLRDDVVAALRRHPAGVLLARMSDLIEARPILWVEACCYDVAARALGPAARSWVERRWEPGLRPDTRAAFLKAAAACLPHAEAVPRALAYVERQGGRDLPFAALPLAHFRSPLVLDWVERTVASPVSNNWGPLAACSGFTWATATRWLEAGRPLSLVALDALSIALRPTYRPFGISIELPDAPDEAAILDHLCEHARRDPAPRVTQAIDRIAKAGLTPRYVH